MNRSQDFYHALQTHLQQQQQQQHEVQDPFPEAAPVRVGLRTSFMRDVLRIQEALISLLQRLTLQKQQQQQKQNRRTKAVPVLHQSNSPRTRPWTGNNSNNNNNNSNSNSSSEKQEKNDEDDEAKNDNKNNNNKKNSSKDSDEKARFGFSLNSFSSSSAAASVKVKKSRRKRKILQEKEKKKKEFRREIEHYLYLGPEEDFLHKLLDGPLEDDDDDEDEESEEDFLEVYTDDSENSFEEEEEMMKSNGLMKKKWSEIDRDLFEREIESKVISYGIEIEGLRQKVQQNKSKYQQFSKLDKKQQDKFLKSITSTSSDEDGDESKDNDNKNDNWYRKDEKKMRFHHSQPTGKRRDNETKMKIYQGDRTFSYNPSFLLFQENAVVSLAERLQQITQVFKWLKSYRRHLYFHQNKFRFRHSNNGMMDFLTGDRDIEAVGFNTDKRRAAPPYQEKVVSLQALRLKQMEEERRKMEDKATSPNETVIERKENENKEQNLQKRRISMEKDGDQKDSYKHGFEVGFSSTTSSPGVGSGPAARGTTSSILEMSLEKENQDLVVELSDELEEYRMVEAKMTEIGSMVSYFIDELVSQHADIVSIHENVEISYDNLETGNEELIKAIERNKNGRRRETLIIFGLAIALLVFDQIIP